MQKTAKQKKFRSLSYFLFIERGVYRVEVLFVEPLPYYSYTFAESLIMYDLPFPQKAYRVPYVGVVDKPQYIVVGHSCFLLCCNHIRTTFD